jgi:hypothetical protein
MKREANIGIFFDKLQNIPRKSMYLAGSPKKPAFTGMNGRGGEASKSTLRLENECYKARTQ